MYVFSLVLITVAFSIFKPVHIVSVLIDLVPGYIILFHTAVSDIIARHPEVDVVHGSMFLAAIATLYDTMSVCLSVCLSVRLSVCQQRVSRSVIQLLDA